MKQVLGVLQRQRSLGFKDCVALVVKVAGIFKNKGFARNHYFSGATILRIHFNSTHVDGIKATCNISES